MKHLTESLSPGSLKGLAIYPLVLVYLPQKQSLEKVSQCTRLVERMISGEGEGGRLDRVEDRTGQGFSWRPLWPDPLRLLEQELSQRIVPPRGKGAGLLYPTASQLRAAPCPWWGDATSFSGEGGRCDPLAATTHSSCRMRTPTGLRLTTSLSRPPPMGTPAQVSPEI